MQNVRHVGSLGTISLSNVTFTNNTADYGGAVWIDLVTQRDPRTVSLYNCQASPVSVVRIHKCTFANNTGYLGSALAVTTAGAYNPFTSLPTSGHIHLVIQDTSFSNHQSPSESSYRPPNAELQFDPCICNSSHSVSAQDNQCHLHKLPVQKQQ